MYSVVMMLAMTTAPDVPACGRRGGGCRGGCYGYNYGGCYGGYGCGGGYGGGYGSAYYGGGGVYAYDGAYGYPYSGYAYSPGTSTVIYPGMSNLMPGQDGIIGNSGPVNWQQITTGDGSTKLAAPVKLEVIVPPDAKLSIDTLKTDSTGTVRMFESPPMESGKDYYYRLTATATRDGKEVKTEKKVAVRAGQTTRATLDFQNGQSENISRPNQSKPDNSRD